MFNKITLFTEEAIDSCHHLENYDGKCINFHGHTWLIQIWIQGDDQYLDKVGILFDFGNIKKIKEKLDHKDLNNVLNINPTAENISKYILDYLVDLNNNLEYRIRIYETAVLKRTYCQRQTGNFDINYI
jgi:6-pyruvoyltetrahydropterin/6-carboxytetrahydropterin synthase